MKLKCGDWVTLSEMGIETLHNPAMSINERIHMTRIFNNGGQVKRLFPEHVEVIPYTPQGELDAESWLIDFRKITPEKSK